MSLRHPGDDQHLGEHVEPEYEDGDTGKQGHSTGPLGRDVRRRRRLLLVRAHPAIVPYGQRRSSRCLQATSSVAAGNALSRALGIGLPQLSQYPYVPESMRSTANGICVNVSPRLAAMDCSCSRSKVLLPASAWSSPGPSMLELCRLS